MHVVSRKSVIVDLCTSYVRVPPSFVSRRCRYDSMDQQQQHNKSMQHSSDGVMRHAKHYTMINKRK